MKCALFYRAPFDDAVTCVMARAAMAAAGGMCSTMMASSSLIKLWRGKALRTSNNSEVVGRPEAV